MEANILLFELPHDLCSQQETVVRYRDDNTLKALLIRLSKHYPCSEREMKNALCKWAVIQFDSDDCLGKCAAYWSWLTRGIMKQGMPGHYRKRVWNDATALLYGREIRNVILSVAVKQHGFTRQYIYRKILFIEKRLLPIAINQLLHG